MGALKFSIEKRLDNHLGRAGTLVTPHGTIETPAFVVVGTKGTVKGVTIDQVKETGAQVTLANTYHLYLQPGADRVEKAGGLSKFMRWDGPTMTDSGGFQVFSLGAAFGQKISKIAGAESVEDEEETPAHEVEGVHAKLALIDEDGVTFRSHLDGSEHRFTPESSIAIQHKIGADMIFAFDECTSPRAGAEYQKAAMDRTHRWAERCIAFHKKAPNGATQGLMGIVQGGRFEDLRKESARIIGKMDFDGFGVGGSFTKQDMDTAVAWVNQILPEEKPRHLLGIGEPRDLFGGVENGCDLFDCVAPTRNGRNGSVYSSTGRMNLKNGQFMDDRAPIDKECSCTTCARYDRAYVCHLLRAGEMLGGILASIHNIHFIVNLVTRMRGALIDGTFPRFKETFIERYYGKN